MTARAILYREYAKRLKIYKAETNKKNTYKEGDSIELGSKKIDYIEYYP